MGGFEVFQRTWIPDSPNEERRVVSISLGLLAGQVLSAGCEWGRAYDDTRLELAREGGKNTALLPHSLGTPAPPANSTHSSAPNPRIPETD